MSRRWREEDHPRDGDGRFTENRAAAIGGIVDAMVGLGMVGPPNKGARDLKPGEETRINPFDAADDPDLLNGDYEVYDETNDEWSTLRDAFDVSGDYEGIFEGFSDDDEDEPVEFVMIESDSANFTARSDRPIRIRRAASSTDSEDPHNELIARDLADLERGGGGMVQVPEDDPLARRLSDQIGQTRGEQINAQPKTNADGGNIPGLRRDASGRIAANLARDAQNALSQIMAEPDWKTDPVLSQLAYELMTVDDPDEVRRLLDAIDELF